MAFQPDSPGVELDPMRVEGSLISIIRTLLVRDQGIVVTIRISPTGEPPIKYQLIDPLPAGFEIDELGFHPDFVPEHGRVDPQKIVVSGLFDSADAHVVKYGLCPATPQAPDMVDSAQSANPPSIELEDQIDPAATDEVDFETPALARGEAARSDLYSTVKRSVFGTESHVTSDKTATPEPVDTTDSEAAAEAVAEAISELEGAQNEDTGPVSDPESVEDLFEQAEDAEQPPTDGPSARRGDPGPLKEPSVTDRLVTELRSASEKDRQALADELSAILDHEPPQLPRSTEVRLQQLESRMEEFSAYSTALRDLIDEHGTPSEFVTDINHDLDDVHDLIADIKTDLDQFDDEQSALSTDLEELETTVDRLGERVADERSALKADLADLEASITDFETEAAESEAALRDRLDSLENELEALNATMADLREDVEDGKARRQAIAEALSGEYPQD